MTDLSLDPDECARVCRKTLEGLGRLAADVERPLRRVVLPEMPASTRADTQAQISAAISTMSSAHAQLARLAEVVRGVGGQIAGSDSFLTAVGIGALLGNAGQLGYQFRYFNDTMTSRILSDYLAQQAALDELAHARARGASPALISALENRVKFLDNPGNLGPRGPMPTVLERNQWIYDRVAKGFPPGTPSSTISRAMAGLGVVGTGADLYLNYTGSAAQSRPAKGISAGLGAAATYTPAGAVLDFASGGALSGGVDGAVTIIADGDIGGAGANAWNLQNLNGDNGWMLQHAATTGEQITPATTGVLNALGGENWPYTDDDGTVDWPLF